MVRMRCLENGAMVVVPIKDDVAYLYDLSEAGPLDGSDRLRLVQALEDQS